MNVTGSSFNLNMSLANATRPGTGVIKKEELKIEDEYYDEEYDEEDE